MRKILFLLLIIVNLPKAYAYVGETNAVKYLSELHLLGNKIAIEDAFNKGLIKPKLKGCLDLIDSTDITPIYSKLIHEKFVGEEIKEADEFLSTELGKKYKHNSFMYVYQALGKKMPKSLILLNKQEEKLINKFTANNGNPILSVNSILAQPDLLNYINIQTNKVLSRCKPKKST